MESANKRSKIDEDEAEESTKRPKLEEILAYVNHIAIFGEEPKDGDVNSLRAEAYQLRDATLIPSTKKVTSTSQNVKRRLHINRPCSPRLFGVYDSDGVYPLPPRMLSNNDHPQDRLNSILGVVRKDGYLKKTGELNGPTLEIPSLLSKSSNRVTGALRHTSLGVINSPIYVAKVDELWSLREISLFEAAICMFGKKFHAISKAIATKNTSEVIAFYYVWKKSKHYRIWKDTYVLHET